VSVGIASATSASGVSKKVALKAPTCASGHLVRIDLGGHGLVTGTGKGLMEISKPQVVSKPILGAIPTVRINIIAVSGRRITLKKGTLRQEIHRSGGMTTKFRLFGRRNSRMMSATFEDEGTHFVIAWGCV
jgi:hypothetical protein